jgi:hypothetical protein
MLLIICITTMIQFDEKITDWQTRENLGYHRDDLGISDHSIVWSSNIKITLIEFSISTSGHDGLITTIYFCNMILFPVAVSSIWISIFCLLNISELTLRFGCGSAWIYWRTFEECGYNSVSVNNFLHSTFLLTFPRSEFRYTRPKTAEKIDWLQRESFYRE